MSADGRLSQRQRGSLWVALLGCVAGCPLSGPEVVPTGTDTPAPAATDRPAETDRPVEDPAPRVSVRELPVTTCPDAPAPTPATLYETTHLAPSEAVDDESLNLVGGGLTVGDLDGDGWADLLLLGQHTFRFRRQERQGGLVVFPEDTEGRFDDLDLRRAVAATAADIDDDGDLDLFVQRWQAEDLLLLNDGSGHFVDGTEAAGLHGALRTQGASFGDLDGDGDLDLFVGGYGPKPSDAFVEEGMEQADASRLWVNQGDGTFVERSELIPAQTHDGYTFTGVWQDVDSDSRAELFVVNDFGWARPGRMFWGRGDGLELDEDDITGISVPFAGMGFAVGDVNRDGQPDFFQTSWKATSFLLSGTGRWFESAAARGLLVNVDEEENVNQIFGWGTDFGDLDNDGDLDLIAGYGRWSEWPSKRFQRDAWWIQDDDGVFHDTPALHERDERGPTRAVVAYDLNDDGTLDVVKRVLGEPVRLRPGRCLDRGWLRLRLRQPAPNVRAVGSKVEVVADGEVWTAWTHAGGVGLYASEPAEVHFGLGDLDTVESVRITWPDGTTDTLTDVSTRAYLEVTRDE